MPKRIGKIIYIISDNRSGSTLLDQLLGENQEILSLGEIHHAAAYARRDRTMYNPVHPLKCSCGEQIDQCLFWSRVEGELGRPLGSLTLKLRTFRKETTNGSTFSRLTKIPRHLIDKYPKYFRINMIANLYGAKRVARDSFALYDAIFRASSQNLIVDSSKQCFRFRTLSQVHPEQLLPILLTRDYRAVVHSKMKRGRSLVSSANGWVTHMRQVASLTADIPAHRLLRVKHEDLCQNPRHEMTRICEHVGVDYSSNMLTRPLRDVHSIGGSPSKFDTKKSEIRLDTAYLSAFSDTDLETLRRIASKTAVDWGYEQ